MLIGNNLTKGFLVSPQRVLAQYPQVLCQFLLVGCLIALLLGISLYDGQMLAAGIRNVNTWIVANFGGLYLWFALMVVVVFFIISLTPIGKIRMGGEDAIPDHDRFSWLAMLLCTGTGIGFMFWGAAEPLFHFMNPPYADTVSLAERNQTAFYFAYMHWGVIPYGLFAFTALALGYWGYNMKRGFCFSHFFSGHIEPTFKNISETLIRSLPDLVTIFAVVFGIATTLGLGVLQVEGGLSHLFHWPKGTGLELGIIAVISVVYLASVRLGLDKGLKTLSNISVILSILLLITIFCLGPSFKIIQNFITAIPEHFMRLPVMGLGQGNYNDPMWIDHWTIKTWSWTITWAPFVGLFIALISKGRTIRELFWGAAMVPAMFSSIWFTVFGQTAINLQMEQNLVGASLTLGNANQVLFQMFDLFPAAPFLAGLSLLIIVVFISNSADSASYTMTCFTYHDIKPDHSKLLQFVWGAFFAILCALLVLTGGLTTLHEITQITALPFTLMLILVFLRVVYYLVKDVFRGPVLFLRAPRGANLRETL